MRAEISAEKKIPIDYCHEWYERWQTKQRFDWNTQKIVCDHFECGPRHNNIMWTITILRYQNSYCVVFWTIRQNWRKIQKLWWLHFNGIIWFIERMHGLFGVQLNLFWFLPLFCHFHALLLVSYKYFSFSIEYQSLAFHRFLSFLRRFLAFSQYLWE